MCKGEHFRCSVSSFSLTSFPPTLWILLTLQYADGGCPCPDGQKRCGAGEFVWMLRSVRNTPYTLLGLNILLDPTFDYLGWCAMECCDVDEESCYEYDHGYSKPLTKQYCKSVRLVKFIFLFSQHTIRTRCNNLLSRRNFKFIDCRRRLPLPSRSGEVWSG